MGAGVRDHARGVDHAGPKEEGVEVVAAVVMIADLFFVCFLLSARLSLRPDPMKKMKWKI